MCVENLSSIVGALMDAGRHGDTALACVMDGGQPSQKVVSTTLARVASSGHPAQLRSPAVIVIGAVAAFATLAGQRASDDAFG